MESGEHGRSAYHRAHLFLLHTSERALFCFLAFFSLHPSINPSLALCLPPPPRLLLPVSHLSRLYLRLSDRREANVTYGNKDSHSSLSTISSHTALTVCGRVRICGCVHVWADIHKPLLSTKVQRGCGQQKWLPPEPLAVNGTKRGTLRVLPPPPPRRLLPHTMLLF